MTESAFLLTKVNLRRLILLLTFVSVLVTLGNGYYTTYQVQKELLLENTLESNRVYATKLASVTDQFMTAVVRQLRYSAGLLSKDINNGDVIAMEVDRLLLQNDYFSRVAVINHLGELKQVSPQNPSYLVLPLNEIYPFSHQRAFISSPYERHGHKSISVNFPMFNDAGTYLGYLSGEMYLDTQSVLNSLFSKHSYHDGTRLFIVGHNEQILYHGDDIKAGLQDGILGKLLEEIKGESGSLKFSVPNGPEILVGYAHIPNADWWVINAKSTSSTLEKMQEHMKKVIVKGLPLTLATLVLIWLSAIYIAKPLRLLARYSHKMDDASSHGAIRSIFSWYAEASQLKYAIIKGMEALNAQIAGLNLEKNTDHMTKLYNRRGMEALLSMLHKEHKDFSTIFLDIDHFKNVNDTYGHATGDMVIREVAECMRKVTRSEDILCRLGGEEFVIFLPDTDLRSAHDIAERLRKTVEENAFTGIEKITISLGVTLSLWQNSDQRYSASLKRADSALYKAKQLGRNQTVVIEK